MEAAKQIIGKINDLIIYPIVFVLFSLGFFLFAWGIVEFMWGMKNGEVSDEGKQHMLWGIIGMFIMVSIGGIVGIIDQTFGFQTRNPNPDLFRNIQAPFN